MLRIINGSKVLTGSLLRGDQFQLLSSPESSRLQTRRILKGTLLYHLKHCQVSQKRKVWSSMKNPILTSICSSTSRQVIVIQKQDRPSNRHRKLVFFVIQKNDRLIYYYKIPKPKTTHTYSSSIYSCQYRVSKECKSVRVPKRICGTAGFCKSIWNNSNVVRGIPLP